MTRPGPFEEMFNLEVGQHLFITPKPGEGLQGALGRIKQRASKYRAQQRSYVVAAEEDVIRVERVPFGQNTKLRRFEMMKAGQRILLSENASQKEIRSAQNTVQYLHGKNRRGNMKRWKADVIFDRLFITCEYDEESYRESLENKKNIKISPQDILRNKIAVYEFLSSKAKENIRRASPAMAEFLKSWVEKHNRCIEVLRHALFSLENTSSGYGLSSCKLKCCDHLARE